MPLPWAASVWKKVFFSLHIAPISLIGYNVSWTLLLYSRTWITPISLLTVMIDTRAVSGRIAGQFSFFSPSTGGGGGSTQLKPTVLKLLHINNAVWLDRKVGHIKAFQLELTTAVQDTLMFLRSETFMINKQLRLWWCGSSFFGKSGLHPWSPCCWIRWHQKWKQFLWRQHQSDLKLAVTS